MSIYDRFGVRTIINAKGPSTRLSGGFLDADDVGNLRQPRQRGSLDVRAGSSGHVVQDERQVDLLGDRQELVLEIEQAPQEGLREDARARVPLERHADKFRCVAPLTQLAAVLKAAKAGSN